MVASMLCDYPKKKAVAEATAFKLAAYTFGVPLESAKHQNFSNSNH